MQDSFYKTLLPEEHAKAHANQYDFDCPDALDFDALVQTLKDLKQGYIVQYPSGCSCLWRREPQS